MPEDRDALAPTNTVILREVAVSILECRGLASVATALASEDGFRDCARNDEVWVQRALRGMTVFGFGGYYKNDAVSVRQVLRE